MITKLRTYLNTADHVLRSRYRRSDVELPLVDSTEVGPVEADSFDDVLAQYDDDVVFVHAGLSDVKSAFERNPYEFLLTKLDEHFESVLVPGFTPSFRSSGVYHRQFSRPEYGTFSSLFLEDADYRTNDAVHSILVRGDYRFEDRDHHESFSERGCWGKLDEDNVLYFNVGTPWIVSTQLHYIEYISDPPYVEDTTFEGVLYEDETTYREISQGHYTAPDTVKWNRSKIEGKLASRGVLSRHDLGGLEMRFFRARETRRALEPELGADPYYLIK